MAASGGMNRRPANAKIRKSRGRERHGITGFRLHYPPAALPGGIPLSPPPAMRFQDIHLHTVAASLPPRVLTSLQLEERLAPLYQRLHLAEGRLELMTGIHERRFWHQGTLPSDAATQAARVALEQSGMDASRIQALLYCGVSRDCVEPATSTAVVRNLGLRRDTLNFDLSNACLGMANAIAVMAAMLASGQVECAMAVTGENAGPLVENTIRRLNQDASLTRQALKEEFASLTIGSAAAAIILTRQGGHPILAMGQASNCQCDDLCRGDAAGGMTEGSAPVMHTDSQRLLEEGVTVAQRMWQDLCREAPWGDGGLPDLVCGHQVSKAHRDLLFQRLGLPLDRDFPIFPATGNCGSASLPLALAMAQKAGALRPGMQLALLGIGSGINSLGFALQW